MAIPENQLQAWSGLGAQKGSADTYNSIQTALASHSWPAGMDHNVYLQGSYPDYTNIRGDSDVDIVCETSNVFYDDAPQEYRTLLGLTGGGSYGWREFRAEVKKALTNYYKGTVVSESPSGKCLKVAGNSNRLDADVVPCVTFRHYQAATHVASGITFWTNTGTQVVNYPKVHLQYGSTKNALCYQNYKPNVRVFKNARNKANNTFPSYFLECMLYNAQTGCYSNSYASTFHDVLVFLHQAKESGSLANFYCQNGQQLIFGTGTHQTSLYSGHVVINDLVNLWNNWT